MHTHTPAARHTGIRYAHTHTCCSSHRYPLRTHTHLLLVTPPAQACPPRAHPSCLLPSLSTDLAPAYLWCEHHRHLSLELVSHLPFSTQACFAGSKNFRVAERALMMFQSDSVVSLLRHHQQAAVRLLVPRLKMAAGEHWNESCKKMIGLCAESVC
eukprot:2269690-Rhodomonas_salina.1